jgi:hypothetical protein
MSLPSAKALFALALSCAVSACATGPTLQEAALPAVAADSARIYVYRLKDGDGWAMTPEIMIDDQLLGQSIRGGILYKDVSAGRHCTAIDRPWLAPIIHYYGTPTCLDLATGEEKYFRVDWKTYLNYFLVPPTHETRLVLMPPEEAMRELSGLVVLTAKK